MRVFFLPHLVINPPAANPGLGKMWLQVRRGPAAGDTNLESDRPAADKFGINTMGVVYPNSSPYP